MSTAQSFDAALRAALAGTSEGFDALYTMYAGRIRAFATARGSEDPDGIANDAMLRCFRHLSSFAGDEAAFVRWLFTIARNRLVDVHRASQRRPQSASSVVPDRHYASAEVLALENLSLDQVRGWLDQLTVDQREVIALRLIEDLSLRDVAEIVGRPVTAVKALQRRGLRRLERIISDEGVS